MPKEVPTHLVQQVMDVTGCTADRARRELELHSVEVAINNIMDNLEPSKVQKISHPTNAPSTSPVRNSAFTSVNSTPVKNLSNQGTMALINPASASKGTFAAIPQSTGGPPLIEDLNNMNQGSDLSEEDQMKMALAASLETAQAPASDVVGSVSDQV